MSAELRDAARGIFTSAMRSVDVRQAVRGEIAVSAGELRLAGRAVALAAIDRVLIVAVGKAAIPMYEAAAESLGSIPIEAVVVAPVETLPLVERPRGNVRFLAGAHPVPTAASFEAADAVLELLARSTEHTAVLFLISGGASAMLERPLDAAISLDDVAAFYRALVGSGMDIREINMLRKHFSAVKGGRLAVAARAAQMQCTLLISDVPAAAPDAIASGPSLPDSSTLTHARRLFARLRQSTALPFSVLRWFESESLPPTPKHTGRAFRNAHWHTVLSSEHLAKAAVHAAETAGFQSLVDNTCDDWEYRESGRYLLDRAQQFAAAALSICLVSVGEVSVTIPRQAGEGGRNQHFALWCATELQRRGIRATVLSAGSDGIDGHSSAAGAVCDETTSARAAALGLSPSDALEAFDTAPLLEKTGDAIQTGPTGNNLRDLRLVLIVR